MTHSDFNAQYGTKRHLHLSASKGALGLLLILSAGFVTSCGGGGNSSAGSPPVAVSPPPPPPPPPPPTNESPTFSSPATAQLNENTTSTFYNVDVSDPEGDAITRLELVSSPDSAFFRFDVATEKLFPATQFDFETPNDADTDNIYNITFEAEDENGGVSQFDVAVTVADVPDNTSFGLQAGLPPSGNFDLLDWKLDLPVDENGNLSGDSDKVDEDVMAAGYESEWFFTGPDGGMVLLAPPGGATTSANTRYTRTELREMLRRGDRSISTRGANDRPNLNNWALSSQPQSAQDDAGGVDGTLRVSMAVNDVTTTGEAFQIGRIIIGQIHAVDDEPIRLYYRKLPDNERGVIYAAHEINGGDDIYYELIGSRSNSADDPANGILLGEIFEYIIEAEGNFLDVTINRADGTEIASDRIDMTSSGYDIENDFMYFKAGNYHQNDTADADDFARVTIYALENTHDGYNP